MKVETVSLTALTPDPLNARKHSKRNLDAIAASLSKFGQRKPIVVTHDGVVIAGNGTLEAASSLDWKEISIARAPKDWDENTVRAYALADNQTGALAEWDDDVLNTALEELTSEGWDIAELGFDLNIDVTEPLNGDLDDVPEAPVTPKTQLGDIYQLGEHRLMCGDSTNPVMVGILMNGKQADVVFTDPPYNTGMTSKKMGSSTRLTNFFDDSYTDSEWETFMAAFCQRYFEILKDNSVAYICLDWRRNHELIPHIKQYFQLSNVIVWDKVVHGLGSDYKYTYELINVCKKGKPTLDTHQGEREYSDVWHIQRKMGRDEDHATKKPVELVTRSLRHSSKKGDLVVDLFMGSGSTLIGASEIGRVCYGMEMNPAYIDVAIQRWETLTGNKAVLL